MLGIQISLNSYTFPVNCNRVRTYAFKSVSRDGCHFTVQKAIIVSVFMWDCHTVWDKFQSRFVMHPGSLIQWSLPRSVWMVSSYGWACFQAHTWKTNVGGLGVGQEEYQVHTRVGSLPWSRNGHGSGYGRQKQQETAKVTSWKQGVWVKWSWDAGLEVCSELPLGGKGGRKNKEKLPAPGPYQLPTTTGTHQSTQLTPPGVKMGCLGSLSPQRDRWLQGSGACWGRWERRQPLPGHPLHEQADLQDC